MQSSEMVKACQTVTFIEDWHVIEILKVFASQGSNKIVSQEELMRKTGLNLYALRSGIDRITSTVSDSIVARPESDGIGDKVLRFWFSVDDLVLWKGKFTFNERKQLGYKLADNIEIAHICKSKVTVRIYPNGN